jgi:hypothetical protein
MGAGEQATSGALSDQIRRGDESRRQADAENRAAWTRASTRDPASKNRRCADEGPAALFHIDGCFLFGRRDGLAVLFDGPGVVTYAEPVARRHRGTLVQNAASRNRPTQSDRRMMYDARSMCLPDGRLPARRADLPCQIASATEPSRPRSVCSSTRSAQSHRDNDSVASHHDRLGDPHGRPIALLSLGGPRRMTISAQDKSIKPRLHRLESGSLLVMDYASQASAARRTEDAPRFRHGSVSRFACAGGCQFSG